MGDKCGKTSVNSCGPRNPECEGQTGDKCKMMRPKAPRVGDKRGRQMETSVNSCGPRQPEWERSVGDKWETSGRQVQTHAAQGTQSGRQVGDKCKIMRPKTPRVKDKCGRQVETSVNSCGPRHPE